MSEPATVVVVAFRLIGAGTVLVGGLESHVGKGLGPLAGKARVRRDLEDLRLRGLLFEQVLECSRPQGLKRGQHVQQKQKGLFGIWPRSRFTKYGSFSSNWFTVSHKR